MEGDVLGTSANQIMRTPYITQSRLILDSTDAGSQKRASGLEVTYFPLGKLLLWIALTRVPIRGMLYESRWWGWPWVILIIWWQIWYSMWSNESKLIQDLKKLQAFVWSVLAWETTMRSGNQEFSLKHKSEMYITVYLDLNK